MRTINESPEPNTGLGERIKPAEPAPQPKPVDTFSTGNWMPGGLRETPKPVVHQESGDEE